MSDNIFEPLVDSLFDSGKILFDLSMNALSKIFKFELNNKIDFEEFFRVVELKNSKEEYPEFIEFEKCKFYDCYRFKVPVGIGIVEFRKILNNLSLFLKIDINYLKCEVSEDFNIEIRILKNELEIIDFSILEKENKIIPIGDFNIPLGLRIDNQKFVYWDMISDADCHCYIAGSTGSGKSNQVRTILSYLINTKTVNDIEFCLFNTKKLDLKEFKDVEHTKDFVHGKDNSLEMIEKMVREMKDRYDLLDKYNYESWTELRKEKRLPYKLIVIEELSEFKGFNKFHKYFNLLLAQGRAAGVYIIATTQLPSRDIMDNEAKQCFNTTIAQKSKDSIRASIIVDDENANLQKLKGKGHSKLYTSSDYSVEYQSFFISKEQIKEIISNKKKNIDR